MHKLTLSMMLGATAIRLLIWEELALWRPGMWKHNIDQPWDGLSSKDSYQKVLLILFRHNSHHSPHYWRVSWKSRSGWYLCTCDNAKWHQQKWQATSTTVCGHSSRTHCALLVIVECEVLLSQPLLQDSAGPFEYLEDKSQTDTCTWWKRKRQRQRETETEERDRDRGGRVNKYFCLWVNDTSNQGDPQSMKYKLPSNSNPQTIWRGTNAFVTEQYLQVHFKDLHRNITQRLPIQEWSGQPSILIACARHVIPTLPVISAQLPWHVWWWNECTLGGWIKKSRPYKCSRGS